MFTECGYKIKKWARILFWVSFILNLAIVISFVIFNYDYLVMLAYGNPFIVLLLAMLFLCITCFYLWLGAIAFYAYGEIADNSKVMTEQLEDIITLLNNK